MNYTEMLNKLIAESNISQKEISDKCKKSGEDVSTTYLSALKNTKGKMASDNISRAIAKACNAKHEEILVVQAYLDKAPKYIIEFLEDVRKVQEQGAIFTEIALASLPNNLKGFADEIKKMKEIKSLAEFICEYKGNMASDSAEFENSMDFLKNPEINIKNMIKNKLTEESNWLLIPIGDMSKSQIVSQKEAEYIQKIINQEK